MLRAVPNIQRSQRQSGAVFFTGSVKFSAVPLRSIAATTLHPLRAWSKPFLMPAIHDAIHPPRRKTSLVSAVERIAIRF